MRPLPHLNYQLPRTCDFPCILIISNSIYGKIFYAYRSLRIEPTAEAYHGLGALFFNSDRMKEAKEAFEHLLRMEPDRVEGICGYVSYDPVVAICSPSSEVFRLYYIAHQLLKWQYRLCVVL